MNNYNSISDFIDNIKTKKDVVGVVEYGSRSFNDNEKGGDYDLTVILKTKKFQTLGGVHFHINGLPIDCMIKNIEDFFIDSPMNKFDYVHLNCNVLYDFNGELQEALNYIKKNWKITHDLTERSKSKFRFRFTHFIDKLKDRINEAGKKDYCNYIMSVAIEQFLECYAQLRGLQIGKPLDHIQYMKNNDIALFNHFHNFFESTDLVEKFTDLKSIVTLVLEPIGGIWKEDEIIFHGTTDYVNEQEREDILSILFE